RRGGLGERPPESKHLERKSTFSPTIPIKNDKKHRELAFDAFCRQSEKTIMVFFYFDIFFVSEFSILLLNKRVARGQCLDTNGGTC
ncbi:MAG: hypothetical protein Q8934_19850, partial [Bacillota bacterium]|nr:hypothetical protein [Bacillota bacterium]